MKTNTGTLKKSEQARVDPIYMFRVLGALRSSTSEAGTGSRTVQEEGTALPVGLLGGPLLANSAKVSTSFLEESKAWLLVDVL